MVEGPHASLSHYEQGWHSLPHPTLEEIGQPERPRRPKLLRGFAALIVDVRQQIWSHSYLTEVVAEIPTWSMKFSPVEVRLVKGWACSYAEV